MRRWTRWSLQIIGLGLLVFLVVLWVNERRGRTIVANTAPDSAAVESEVRTSLPIGTSRSAVESFLLKRGIEFSPDPSSESIYAVWRNLRGSTRVASKSLQVHFSFDNAGRLKNIDAKVLYTGP
jgi:hypothetical protein